MEMWRNELYHHGILGQKWGIRRFQNSDGTRTSLGKKRYAKRDVKQMSDEELKEFAKRNALENAYKKANKDTTLDDASSLLNSTNNASQQSANAVRKMKKISDNIKTDKQNKNAERIDISKMSDKELQQLVNRQNLEAQYARLNPQTVRTGSDYAADILETVGSVAAVGASALAIAVAMKQLLS